MSTKNVKAWLEQPQAVWSSNKRIIVVHVYGSDRVRTGAR